MHAVAADWQGEPAITLRAGELAATFVPDVGMTGVSVEFGGREHLVVPGGLDALRAGATGGLPLLAPWANRLSSRRFVVDGVPVDLEDVALATDGNGLPIHGLLVGRPGWRVERVSDGGSDATVEASIELDSAAFPFPHRIELTVAVQERALTVATTVIPTGDRPVPIAFGWHPYLRLPGSSRRTWRLHLPARRHVVLDGLGIPTGEEQAESPEADPIGDRTFDDLYRLDVERRLRVDSDDGTAVELRSNGAYPYAQVWVPAGEEFLALEPMTAQTDALVSGRAPLVAPGDELTASFTLGFE